MNSYHLKEKLIIIAGPTGIGKTSIAVKMASKFNGEIIGADSMQIYKDMTIGTAAPTPEELEGITHHLIHIIKPDEHCDAAQYSRIARQTITEVIKRGQVPFLVGGTGLYIKTAVAGIFSADTPDPALRHKLQLLEQQSGVSALHEELQRLDPKAALNIHPRDRYRIIRALEVFHQTNKSIITHHQEHKFPESPYLTLKIGIKTHRHLLYEHIERRVDNMISAGLVREVQNLLDKGYSPDLKPLKSIGYRQIIQYLSGDIDLHEAVNLIKRDTRRYAKRQLTWFNADPDMIWIQPHDLYQLEQLIQNFLQLTI